MRKSIKIIGICAVIYVGLDLYNTVPNGADYPPSYYASHDDTQLARRFAPLEGGENLAVPLFSGSDALAARLRLIEQAEKAIDIQYFLEKPDFAGALITAAVLRAADRGVKVRFLLDDIFTTADDDFLLLMNEHPSIEFEFYNPISRKLPKYLNYPLDLGTINRRMHNKSMTVDGSVAIIGGRNIADEYYDIDKSQNFADFDLLLAGDVVDEIGLNFDKFWNDEYGVPAKALLGEVTDRMIEEAKEQLAKIEIEAVEEKYREAMQSDYLDGIEKGEIAHYLGAAKLYVDDPQKLRESPRGELNYEVVNFIRDEVESAQSEITFLSPYFVPEDWGSELFQSAAERGVKTQIITNSLMSTNHAYVQGGYYYRRPELLEAGVELYETRVDAVATLNPSASETAPNLTLHSKLAVVDRKRVLVMSLNFDPRSTRLNTELALVFENADLAEAILAQYERALPLYTYQVRLDAKGNVEWFYEGKGHNEVYTREPASFWRKFVQVVTRILPVEMQL